MLREPYLRAEPDVPSGGGAVDTPGSLELNPELSIDEQFPNVVGSPELDEQGFTEHERELKSHFDRQVSEMQGDFKARLDEVKGQLTNTQQPQADPETVRLANMARSLIADPAIAKIYNDKIAGRSADPTPDDKGDAVSALEAQLRQIEEAIPEDGRYNPGQKMAMAAQIREPMRQLIEEAVAPLKEELAKYKSMVTEQIDPLKSDLKVISDKTYKSAWNQGASTFFSAHKEATDPRILNALAEAVQKDPRTDPALKRGDDAEVARIFRQTYLSDFENLRDTMLKETAEKAEKEKANAAIERGGVSLEQVGLPTAETVDDAVMSAYKTLGMPTE